MKAGGEASLANMTPYITSKFNNFISNDYMRPIIGQAKSAFNFRDVMDNGKILLINLSKGPSATSMPIFSAWSSPVKSLWPRYRA